MPHDRNDNVLQVGDVVMVPCRVKAIHLTEEFCNLDLETIEVLFPSNNRSALTLNAKQTVKPWPNERGDLLVYSK